MVFCKPVKKDISCQLILLQSRLKCFPSVVLAELLEACRTGLETGYFIFKKDDFFFLVWLYLFPELVPCSDVQVWEVTEEGGIIGCGGAFG